jgi:hypothetical protein
LRELLLRQFDLANQLQQLEHERFHQLKKMQHLFQEQQRQLEDQSQHFGKLKQLLLKNLKQAHLLK